MNSIFFDNDIRNFRKNSKFLVNNNFWIKGLDSMTLIVSMRNILNTLPNLIVNTEDSGRTVIIYKFRTHSPDSLDIQLLKPCAW